MAVETSADGVVCVAGEVDLSTAAAFEAALRAALQREGDEFVVDIQGVTFVDSAGMNVLVRVFKLLQPAGRALVLCGANPSIRRALEIGGAAQFAELR